MADEIGRSDGPRSQGLSSLDDVRVGASVTDASYLADPQDAPPGDNTPQPDDIIITARRWTAADLNRYEYSLLTQGLTPEESAQWLAALAPSVEAPPNDATAFTLAKIMTTPIPSGGYQGLLSQEYGALQQRQANSWGPPDPGRVDDEGWILDFVGGLAATKDLAVAGGSRALGWFAKDAVDSAPLSIEAQFGVNSLRLADEGHGLFMQGLENGDIVPKPRLSMEIQRGSFVDEYIRQGDIALRGELGLDATTVRINQRLYAPNGKYTVPDLHFPGSGNSIDYSYQLKNVTTPRIMRIQQAAPNGMITIVPPTAVRPVYTIRP